MMSELEVLQYWDDHHTFQQSIDQRPKSKSFVFYDGPPFATGLPHYGTILASVIKDVIPRFWTMKGKRVARRWGWDCHGLPIENLIEKKLKLGSRKEILNFGVGNFNEECRSSVLQYVAEWKKMIRRIGRWVDMEHDYKTMNPEYMESIWWVFQSLWKKGLVYEGRKAMHICPRCETALSNFEVTQGYKDITDLSVTARFRVKATDDRWKNTSILGWTTTPWTLPGNVALAVKADADYVRVPDSANPGHWLVLGKEAFERMPDSDPQSTQKTFKGADLVGVEYEPLFDYYAKNADLKDRTNGWKLYSADFVTTTDGTGIVHIAPAFGEDDMRLGVEQKLPFVQHVGMNGMFVAEVTDFAGEPVKPTDDPQRTDVLIIKNLAHRGLLFAKEKFTHSYPHCWRCETPLLNYSTTSWFVKVTQLKNRMLVNNKRTQWIPEAMRDGRFGHWLEGARDWAISRSRYWGTPLPIWRSDDGETLCIGSREELEQLSGASVTDLHKHFIDQITIKKNGKVFHRIDDVLDCWFESGSMPYAQVHYPFEHKKDFRDLFPAEFIGEGQDQTRGWFYTLHVLATALFDKPAFENVIVNGIVLAEDGKKMSKHLKNYPDPDKLLERYGADALRIYMSTSPVMQAENLLFSEKGVDEMYKKVNLLTGNIVSFWQLYATDVANPSPEIVPKSSHPLDLWIHARTLQTIDAIAQGLEAYTIAPAAQLAVDYIQDLSTWYVRRSRDRVKSDDVKDKTHAVQTLGWSLRCLATMLAPFTPMLAESIYQSLHGNAKESIHLTLWPRSTTLRLKPSETKLLNTMAVVRSVVSATHTLRATSGVKVRQPLQQLWVSRSLPQNCLGIIAEETNVKIVSIGVTEAQPSIAMLETDGITVALDTTVNETLKREGVARELVRQLNGLRKRKGLTINDRVAITLSSSSTSLPAVIDEHREVLIRSTLATSITWSSQILEGEELEIEGEKVRVLLHPGDSLV